MVRFEKVFLAVCLVIPVTKCAVFFPSNSAYGIFAAIAVPLDLGPHRNVFVSYNFEANYNLPSNWQLPTYLNIVETRLMKGDTTGEPDMLLKKTGKSNGIIGSASQNDTSTNENQKDKKIQKRSLLSRKIFYEMLKQKLEMHGYNGESCLLRIICETNISAIGDVNGILGSVFHILFAPSSSKDEGLPYNLYKAATESRFSQCSNYQEKCPNNILDVISKQLSVNIEEIN